MLAVVPVIVNAPSQTSNEGVTLSSGSGVMAIVTSSIIEVLHGAIPSAVSLRVTVPWVLSCELGVYVVFILLGLSNVPFPSTLIH